MIHAFIQARMTSARFPGKVLAPFRGRPVIAHVIERVRRAPGIDQVIVATSLALADDPLAAYVGQLGVPVFRGPLDNVLERFRLCARAYPSDWILRVSADSPLLDPDVLRRVIEARLDGCDVVTTIWPRTFASGQNAELLRTAALLAVDPDELSAADREHVTPFFYRHPERFRIVNVTSGSPERAGGSVAIDTIDDLQRLEQQAPVAADHV